MSEAFIPLLSLLAKSSLIVICAYALGSALKALRIGAAARHLIWLTAVVAIALLPLLALALPPLNIALPYDALGFATPDISTPGEHLPDRSNALWIWVAYAIGAFAMLARLIVARTQLRALWRRARTYDGRTDDITRLASAGNNAEVRISDQNMAPLTWGARVLLPADAVDWPEARRRDVLLHELCHMARRDSLTQMLAAIVRAAFWFSPAVWFALRELRIEQEHACDERVIATGAEGVSYAQTLVEVAAASRPASLGMGVSSAMVQPSNLERRVLSILQPERARPLSAARTAVLSAALLCAGCALAAAQPRDSARILGLLSPLTAMQLLTSETPPLAPLPRLTGRVNVPEPQDANSKR